ncbi:hypothetical protein LWI29_028682 [Acer saccharum]|uniref:CCHC-type domain-containing protein n=1 Tax=Acer saccharum TaxID=4024 RepID=A0AA39RZ06_ACESA|nr:hypothetical protein LWI29_028682 [Acer saccharum]
MKKKNHFKHFKNKKGSSKRFKFFRKKAKRGWNKSQHCYICGQPGHYAKKCPNKKAKSARLVQQLKNIADEVPSDADIESIFSEQDHTDPSTTFVLQEDVSDSEYSGSSNYSSVPESYQATPIVSHFGPQAPVQIRPDNYSKPVDVIAYFDTGSHNTMMNPTVLPPEYWKSQEHHFRAADGKVFSTHLISRKKIGIQFFPSFTLWVQVLGTPLPDKDILLGWDIFCQCKSLRILPSGIRYKKNFKTFSDIPKIFLLSVIQAPFEHIQQKLLLLCANNHATFSHPSPLWKNPDFFIKLPFKLNEDTNPTKATHFGMSPSDLKLANEECNELLRQALIYIDDILLFSPDETSHNLLLQQFHDIVHHYGIILSEKKSIVGRPEIEFLGMHISNGQYRPGPHLVVRLLDFPDSDLSVHQVQQFLGIVNYVRDFIPHVSHYTSVLFTLLKKHHPPWSFSHTEAILKLKEISQSPPALTIPSSGQLVLQTDASDIFWGAVLIEDREGQRSYCGHASGKFKDSQQHYHTIYKEILAVKYGIQKLDFHLRIRNFIVEMDNSSFPKVLDFCNKIPPNPLLLRLKDWFARYDFTVRHVKGHHNIIADMLSRSPLTHLITPTGHYPLIYMASPVGPSSSSSAIQDYFFPLELLATLPPDHQPSLDQIQ